MMSDIDVYYKLLLIGYMCWCISSPCCTEASVSLAMTPSRIEVGTTSKLTGNCTYRYDLNQSSPPPILTSLSLSRRSYRQNATSAGLAYMSIQTPTKVTALTGSDVTSLNGNVTIDGIPSLFVSWDNPSEEQIGTYTCEATFVDPYGYTHLTHQDFQVVKEDFHLSYKYTVTMTALKNQIEAAKDCCSSLSQNVKDAEQWKSKADVGIQRLLKYLWDVVGLKISNEYKGKMYVFTKQTLDNADKAKDLCKSIGGYLLEVEDADEWNFIKSFISKGPLSAQYYIGGQDDVKEGDWYWATSNTTMTFTAWRPGEPNNIFGIENCLEILKIGNYVQWNDLTCQTRLNALCEVDKVQ